MPPGYSEIGADMISRAIARYPIILCAAPSYLATRGEPGNINDLAAHDCLLFSSRSGRQAWRFQDGDEWVEVNGRSRMRLDSGEAIRGAALAGMGIARLPGFLVGDDLASGRLRPLLSAYDTEPVPIRVIYSSRRHLAPRIRAFIDVLVRHWRVPGAEMIAAPTAVPGLANENPA